MRFIVILVLVLGAATPVLGSQFALGFEKESWSNVDLDISTNPGLPPTKELGFSHLKFSVPDITTFYLEEPGFIFGAISGMAETEGNRVAAEEKARRDGSLTYSYEYGRPAPIPEGRWNRWSVSTGKTQGATVVSESGIPTFDSTITLQYLRINMDIVTGPTLWGDQGIYWMPSGDISIRSFMVFQAPKTASTDFSTMAFPFNFHLGYQPKLFPWFTIEGRVGWDFISWGLFALAGMGSSNGLQNYTQGYQYGAKASLGVEWISFYWDFSHRIEPLWNLDGYARRYEGDLSALGVRVDVGNLLAKFVK